MDFSYSEQERQFRDELRAWLEQNLPGGWLEGRRNLPDDPQEEGRFLREWQYKLYEGGWAGLSWPKEYGGRGATLIEEVIYEQELARVKAPPVLNLVGLAMVGPTLIQIGTEEQKRKYLSKILTGEEIWSQGYSEPNAGSDLANLQTKAEKLGDRWLINGQKIWTTYAHLSDRCFVLARTANTGKKHEGITAFIVDMHQEGIETRPIHQINDHSEFNETFFTNAVAYDEDIVGEVNDGWRVSLLLLSHERVGVARIIFQVQQQFQDLVAMVKQLKKNGQPLIDDPLVRHHLADFYAKINGTLYNYYRNLTTRLRKGTPGAEGSIDKLLSSELMKELYGYGVSLQGPFSTLWKKDAYIHPEWQDEYIRSFSKTIAGGTSEIQRNIVGERILGLPKDIKK